MVKREREVKEKITAKGILTNIDGQNLVITDPKSGDEEIVSISELKVFLNKEISFSIAQVDKQEIEE